MMHWQLWRMSAKQLRQQNGISLPAFSSPAGRLPLKAGLPKRPDDVLDRLRDWCFSTPLLWSEQQLGSKPSTALCHGLPIPKAMRQPTSVHFPPKSQDCFNERKNPEAVIPL